ncbi:DUF3800 domain-containing protein [Rhodococcoides kyotonense]|uniref:DUF3800 domain-containing protein n=1 Tax=Rhodococcoides kyotonense TaxID=398843 RepID=A0A239F310_9NOCA|nr:DUF3800 domain-containing protein [Rhodococcus kyotonensis]SNS50663.1 Protein of unknown function [Rhodococcus kyotonensis]
MRLYYFDDSGDRANDPTKPYFVMGGFGIDADDLPKMQQVVRNAAVSYGFPLSYPSELKFSQVGRSKDNKPNKPHWMIRAGLTEAARRRALVYSCLRALVSIPSVKVIVIAVDQSKTWGSSSPIMHAVKPLFERINHDCGDHSTQGLVFFDEEQADDKALRQATRLGSFYMPFDRIIESISFMPSDESVGVQMADLVAGAFGRYMNTSDPGYARLLWPHLRRSAGGLVHGYGIKLFPRGHCPEMTAQPVPWPPADRKVYEYECGAQGQSVMWMPSGEPVVV